MCLLDGRAIAGRSPPRYGGLQIADQSLPGYVDIQDASLLDVYPENNGKAELMAETMKWKTRQEADEALKAAETIMLDAESTLEDAKAEFERAESDRDEATTTYERISEERRKVFLGHTPDPPDCLKPFLPDAE